VLYQRSFTYGDPDAAMAGAPHVVRLSLRQDRHANVPLETRGLTVTFDPATGTLDVLVAHQSPHLLRLGLHQHLGIPLHHITVRCGDIGGSFGQKAYVTREEIAVAAVARRIGRPLQWIEDRVENLLVAGHARDEEMELTAAVDSRGAILGLEVTMRLDQGAYQLTSLPSTIFPTIARVLLPSAYRIEHYRFTAVIVATHKPTYVAYRGPWEAETFGRERLLDRVAAELRLDPIEVRRRNLWQADELPRQMVTGPTLQNVTARETLERAVALADMATFRADQAAARAAGRYLGVGLATFIEPSPGPPDYTAALGVGASPRTAQRAVARLEADGTLTVFTSQSPHGQSHETTLGQLAADGLGLALDQVRVVCGDTRLTPFNLVGTGGSRAATLASGAVMGAVAGVRTQVARIAAHLAECDPADIEIVDAMVQVRGVPASARPLAAVAAIAYTAAGQLPPDIAPGLECAFDFAIPEGGWSQATHVAWVEVDVETGVSRVLRYLVVEDCGALVNPAVVEGQIRGGVAQGIGSVLCERSPFSRDGQPLATNLLDYLLPTAVDIPRIEIHHLESPPQGPVDFRGVGEGGAIGAPAAVVNAVEDALAPFGIVLHEQHLSPSRLLASIHASATPPE
jgi:carbon-monoxide dehydrogenase large subunit